MKQLLRTSLAVLATTLLTGCGDRADAVAHDVQVPRNSIYHWKTVFDIDSTEQSFLKKHDIDRVFLRMFDVAMEQDFLNGVLDIVPIATTRFLSPIPAGVEIVPVTYITIDALRAMVGREQEFASLIVERLLAMATHNGCGEIKEIQLDCDWTATTKDTYNRLCKAVKESLSANGIELSITVRLHQLQETPPPADKGVLMVYNTGTLKNRETCNSILHIDNVKPYLKETKYPIPLDHAYPVFGWGVKFKDNKFVSIVSYDHTDISNDEFVRFERASSPEVLAVKELVEQTIGKPANGNILYHLDHSQFKHYTDNEISQILSY